MAGLMTWKTGAQLMREERNRVEARKTAKRLCCDGCGFDYSLKLAGQPCPDCGGWLFECNHTPEVHS